jgi:hypothetical protein
MKADGTTKGEVEGVDWLFGGRWEKDTGPGTGEAS